MPRERKPNNTKMIVRARKDSLVYSAFRSYIGIYATELLSKRVMNAYEVAKALCEDESTVTRYLRSLEKEGFVKPIERGRRKYFTSIPSAEGIYNMSPEHERNVINSDYGVLLKQMENSIIEGSKWLVLQEVRLGKDLSGFENERTINAPPRLNVELSAFCAEILAIVSRDGLVPSEERIEINGLVGRVVNFLLSQQVENGDTIAYRNPYLRGEPLDPKVTGDILKSLISIEDSGIVPSFHLPEDFRNKACTFIEISLRNYLEKVIPERSSFLQDPVTTIVVSLLGYIRAKGKNSIYDSSFAREFLRELARYQRDGGFRSRLADKTPSIEHTAIVVYCLLDENFIGLKPETAKEIGLLEALKDARQFLTPRKGEKLLISSHPSVPAVRAHALLLLGVHPCNQLAFKPTLQWVLEQQRLGSWEDNVEQTHHCLAHVVWYYKIIQQVLKNPLRQRVRMEMFS